MKENKEDALVTIVCTVFNHEKYLKKAIDGFLMQKCNFNYSIYIQDDCSTDNSKKLIQEYEKKYPDIIKGYYLDENIYGQGISPLFNLIEKVKTKYVAVCEGDDYWTDEFKLQKQIDFLESKPDYVATYHNVLVVDDDSKLHNMSKKIMPLYIEHDFTIEDIQKLSICCSQSASLVFINFWKDWNQEYKKKYLECNANGDIKLNSVLLFLGKVHFLEDIMSCYRKSLSNDSWSSQTKDKNLSLYFIESRKSIEELIKYIFNQKIKFCIGKYSTNALIIFIKNPTIYNLNIFITSLKNVGVLTFIHSTFHFLTNRYRITAKKTYWDLLDNKTVKENINE